MVIVFGMQNYMVLLYRWGFDILHHQLIKKNLMILLLFDYISIFKSSA